MIVGLEHVAALERAVVGSKAAHLARALARGFAVPPGFVVPVGVNPSAVEVLAAVNDLGGPFAVRSSALAEDLVEASYAGLYESYLNVSAADVPEAIRSCRGSGDAERVNAYRDPESEAGVAVLVQRMVPASAAGVAFTANPLTGARDETIVTAVTGLGESLVAGEAVGEEWFIRDGNAHLTRSADVLEARQAVAIAELARRAAELFDGPQDIEWAIAGGDLHLLQARPMTALPDPVTWPVPGRGLWVSNFRIGEWLPDPVTPLFGDWLLPLLDDGFRQGMQETAGSSVPFGYALVNDWYYSQPNPSFSHLPAAILRSRTPDSSKTSPAPPGDTCGTWPSSAARPGKWRAACADSSTTMGSQTSRSRSCYAAWTATTPKERGTPCTASTGSTPRPPRRLQGPARSEPTATRSYAPSASTSSKRAEPPSQRASVCSGNGMRCWARHSDTP